MEVPVVGPRLRYRALTLIEVLVVLGIVGILSAIMLPAVEHSRRVARQMQCAGNIKDLNTALIACVTENSGYLPDAYYSFADNGASYTTALRVSPAAESDAFFKYIDARSLVCPSDNTPAVVLGRTRSGRSIGVVSSYAYNVNLPLRFRNSTRVREPLNTATFYDGNAAAVVGDHEYTDEWAAPTIRKRHFGCTNYGFLDGHVETSADFPAFAFTSGTEWLTFSVKTASGHSISGEIDINLNPAAFLLKLPDGTIVTMADLKDSTEDYVGPAVLWQVKPKGGQTAVVNVDGKPYTLEKNTTYTITAESMTVQLYNDRRDAKGRPSGHWYIRIVQATSADIQMS